MQQTYRPVQRHPWPFLSTLGRSGLATPPVEQPADSHESDASLPAQVHTVHDLPEAEDAHALQ